MTGGLPDPLPAGARDGSIGSLAFVQSASTEFLGPSPKRVALIIGVAAGVNAVFNNRPIASQTDGFQLQAGAVVLYLRKDLHGLIVTKPWFVFSSTGAGTVSWLEVLEG